MKVSVIIPCRNEVKHIASCIESIYQSELTADFSLEVIVVDGLSNDGTLQVLNDLKSTYPNLQIIANEKQVTPIAFNLGIKNSTGDFVQIIGARQIIDKKYLQTGIKTIQQNKEIWCVGGQVENIYENKASKCIALAMDTPFGVGVGNFRTLKKSAFTDTVGTPMYPRNVFEKIGFFDEDLVRNQDDEFNFRVTKAGGKMFLNADMKIRYFVRANFKNLFRQYFQYGYWKVFVNRKHKMITSYRQLAPPLFILFLISGWLSVFIHPIAAWIYAGICSFYFLVAILFALKKANPKSEFYLLFYTFMILHFGYGFGYLKGIFDFYLLRKQPGGKQKNLTR